MNISSLSENMIEKELLIGTERERLIRGRKRMNGTERSYIKEYFP
jgi:hypothetical protein